MEQPEVTFQLRQHSDTYRTGLVIQDLADAGVGIVFYWTDELISIDTAVDKFLVAARNFASELEREKISQRTYENLLQKARAGRPAGGISYGYAIEDKQYVVRELEAVVVRRIFAEYASGAGQRSIARQLNDDGLPSPRAGKRGTGSLAPSAIRAILTNPRYAGQGRYNQTRKLYRSGTKVRENRPLAEHFTYECPAIIDESTWTAVQRRFEANEHFGAPSKVAGAKPRYLLTGLSRCAVCGGPITVGNRKRGQVNERVYICGWRKDRGLSVCRNTTAELVEDVNERVVQAVKALFTPQVVSEVLVQLRTILAERTRTAPAKAVELEAEAARLKREIERLMLAIATTDEAPSALTRAVAERDKRLRDVELERASVSATAKTFAIELDHLERDVMSHLDNLSAEFEASPDRARAVLGTLTAGERFRFEPNNGVYRVVGSVAVPDLLMAGTAPDRFASPAGFEPSSRRRALHQACRGLARDSAKISSS